MKPTCLGLVLPISCFILKCAGVRGYFATGMPDHVSHNSGDAGMEI